MYKKLILATLFTTAGSQVIAQEATGFAEATQEYGAISPKISTLGLGLEYKYPVTDTFSASAGIYGASFSRDEKINNVKYDAKLKLRHLALLGNYYPWENGFHIAGGVVVNGTKFEANVEAALPDKLTIYSSEGYTFNGNTYTIGDVPSVSAKADFRKLAPYLGIGYDNGNKGGAGWSVAASAGIMFSGSPNLSFDYTCTMPEYVTYAGRATSSGLNCEDFKNDIDKEKSDLQNELDKMKAYPVLSVGVMYKF